MGLSLSLLYVFFLLLSPAYLVPELGDLRIQVWVVVPAILATILTMVMKGYPIRAPQNYLLGAFFSLAVLGWLAHGWFGGVSMAFFNFAPIFVIYLLFAVNPSKPYHFRIIGLVIVGVATFYSIRGIMAYHFDIDAGRFLMARADEEGALVGAPRIRGSGLVEDPNELGQLLLVALCFLGFFYRKGRSASFTFPLLILPLSALLVYGVYLTRSRGTLLGLLALVFVIFYQSGRKTWALVMTGFTAALAGVAKLTDGRGIGIQEGSDRLILWGDGLQIFKSSPLIGIGYGAYLESSDMTAHNSFILCMAEQGWIGYFFWMGALVVTYYELYSLNKHATQQLHGLEELQDIRIMQRTLVVWTVTSFFLSLTYAPMFYLVVGMSVAAITAVQRRLAEDGGLAPVVPLVRPFVWARATLLAQVASVVVIYLTIRLRGII